MPFLGALLATGPEALRPLLLDALGGYQEELGRFAEAAAALGVQRTAPALVTHAYLQYLLATALRSWPGGLVCLAVLERAYLDAWRNVLRDLDARSPRRPLIEQWASDGFAAYVDRLTTAVDELAVPSATRDDLEEHVDRTLQYEAAFWEMAWPVGTGPGAAE